MFYAMRRDPYPRFRLLDGSHPYRDAVPGGHVAYPARRRRGGRVAWFNFDAARRAGLIGPQQADRLNPQLEHAILGAFCFTIINEYDLEHGRRFSSRDVLPKTYVATRYLQLQHPGRTGKTSGDGRSVWIGSLRHRGRSWDVSACGTGVTRLCPATALSGRHFPTGGHEASYGCGTAAVAEGLVAALLSETFHANGIATERVLAVIELPHRFAINVRIVPNLLRPSHFFAHSKQRKRDALRGSVEVFGRRQIENRAWPRLEERRALWRYMAEDAARTFARMAATFDREYVFCWLDWDGDNILADGGIIDYGSVRQFGLYHRGYRFDDGPRWSTTLPEQRQKARHIVQNFVQIRDYLLTGKRRPLAACASDPVLRLFDRTFERRCRELLLHHVGLDRTTARRVLARHPRGVERLWHAIAWLEQARSSRGRVKVGDGVTWNAIFSARDVLRQLPERVFRAGGPIDAYELLGIALSSYATRRDRRPTPWRRRRVLELQAAWLALLEAAARVRRESLPLLLQDVAARSAVINRIDRITGDAAIHASERLLRERKRLGPHGLWEVVSAFVARQTLDPDRPASECRPGSAEGRRVLDALLGVSRRMRHGI